MYTFRKQFIDSTFFQAKEILMNRKKDPRDLILYKPGCWIFSLASKNVYSTMFIYLLFIDSCIVKPIK